MLINYIFMLIYLSFHITATFSANQTSTSNPELKLKKLNRRVTNTSIVIGTEGSGVSKINLNNDTISTVFSGVEVNSSKVLVLTTSAPLPVVVKNSTQIKTHFNETMANKNGTTTIIKTPLMPLSKNSTLLVKLSTTTTTTTTVTPTSTTTRIKKPTITYASEDLERSAKIIDDSSSSSNKFPSPSRLNVEESETPHVQPSQEFDGGLYRNHRDYIIPIVSIIFAVPILMGMVIVAYRRFRDFWSTRHYRRMDFLVDGMYND